MSCWVVPIVAAEYWGVTLDVVWRRIYDGLVPHRTDHGFVFVDVDPWSPVPSGIVFPEQSPTFVVATGSDGLNTQPDTSFTHTSLADALPPADWEVQAPVSPEIKLDATDVSLAELASLEASSDVTEHATVDSMLDSASPSEPSGDEDDGLPPLDEEEDAAFGRLSWREVRAQVSRTRRPPRCNLT